MFGIFRLPRPSVDELRGVVDDLPLGVRIAMLEGVRSERVIAGAYADGTGGVCPMLAAHRHGARWSHPDFARTWDEFAHAPIEGLRDADPRHVRDLVAVLAASIEADLRVSVPEPSTPEGARRIGPRRPALDDMTPGDPLADLGVAAAGTELVR